jgi:hypothetical protein
MWRFKTKEEFAKEYGKSWREKVPKKWNSSGEMDYLLGQEIKPEFLDLHGRPACDGLACTISKYGISPYRGRDSHWSICPEMVIFVEDKVGENYEVW